jgi:hypothetical protein
VRSFVIGVTLLVLLFGGFVVGVEAGTHPLEQTAATHVPARKLSVHTVTVQTPVASTVVDGHVRLVRLTTTRVVVITRHGKKVMALEPAPGSTDGGPLSADPPTLYTVPTETVTETEPGTTVTVTETETEPGSTVTVTEPGSSDTTSGSTTP